MACTGCGAEKVFARGYCQGCYNRLRRRGTLERKNVVNSGRCHFAGCEREAFAKNLCGLHYSKARHPLWNVWKLLGSRHRGQLPEDWCRFDNFLRDVGERPSDLHRLMRKDASRPFSAGNVEWHAPVIKDAKRGGAVAADRPKYFREWHLSKRFGMSLADYMAMHTAQDGKCAICTGVETVTDRMGRIKPLAVDHDHRTGAVRGLACNRCNHILGLAADSIPILQAAIAYLQSHE